MTVVNPKSISGINSITMASGSDNLLTIHTTNTTERVRVNSDGDVIVGSGITVSPDGDIFATGVTTSTTFSGNFSGGTVTGTTGTFTGDVDIADKIVHTGDTDTAIRFPSADTITAETGGTERLRIDSSGRIGVGVVPTTQFNHSLIQIGNQATLGANGALSSTGQTFLTHNLYYDTGGTYQVFNTSNANEGAIIQIREAYFAFSNSPQTTGTPTVTERFRIAADGDVEVKTGNLVIGTSGKGIDFSATSDGNGTDSSELFDDYEEGSFTPYIDRENGSPIVGYDAQDGYYTKIGRMVYFHAEVRINSYNGNGSYGLTYLRGLPYNSAARDGGRGVWNSVTYHSYYRDMTTTDGEKDIAVVQQSSEKVVFYIQRSENSWATPPAPDANDQFKIGGFYPV